MDVEEVSVLKVKIVWTQKRYKKISKVKVKQFFHLNNSYKKIDLLNPDKLTFGAGYFFRGYINTIYAAV